MPILCPATRRTVALAAALAAALLVLPGCDTTEPRTRDVSGTWVGALTLENEQVIGVALALQEGERGAVTGEGVLGPGVFDFQLTVQGVHDQTSVSLTMTTADGTELFFLGEWSGEDRLEGTVGGALGGDLTLDRE